MENKNSPEILKNLQRNCLVPERKNRIFGAMLIFLVLGVGFVIPIVGGAYLGRYLDKKCTEKEFHGQ